MTSVTAAAGASATMAAGGPVAVTVSGGSFGGALPGAVLDMTALTRAMKGSLAATLNGQTVTVKAGPAMALPAIPEGARLTVQVGAQGQMLLTAVNGRALGTAAGQTAAATGQDHPVSGQPATAMASSASGSASPAGTPAAVPPGLTATVLRAAASPPSGLPVLGTGTQISVRIVEIASPGAASPAAAGLAPSSAPATASPPPGAVSPMPAGAASPASSGAVMPSPSSSPSSSGAGTGTAAPPPSAMPSPPAPGAPPTAMPAPLPTTPGPTMPSAAGTAPPSAGGGTMAPSGGAPMAMVATVVAQPPAGQAVVATPLGTLALPVPTPLTVGTTLQLELGPVASSPPLPPPPAVPEGLGNQGWPALTDAMGALAGTDRQALDTLMRVMPQASPHLAAAMAGFAGAGRRGDGRQVVPDQALKALEKAGRSDVAARLRKDLGGLQERPVRTMAGSEGWQMQTMPFVDRGAITPITLYVRGGGADDQGEGRSQGKGGGDHRFILEFRLTNLGRLQLDGLVRKPDKLFDLIIRTQAPLPEVMRMDIMAIFTQSSDIVGTKGSVIFQVGGGWVDFQPPQPGPLSIQA